MSLSIVLICTGMFKFGTHGLGTQDLCAIEQCGKLLEP